MILVLSPLVSIAQHIKGIVVAKKNNLPVENTNVLSLSGKIGTVTDKNGTFSLELLPQFKENEILEFSHIGFTTLKISIEDLKKTNFKVLLSEETENLSGLTIKANHDLKLKSKLSFTTLAPLKYPLFSFGSFLKDGKIYVIGGDGSRESDAWKKVTREKADPTLKDLQDELRQNSTFLFYKGDFSTYDIKSDSWETLPIKFTKRACHNIHLYDNSIYVLGGKRISVNGKFEYLQDQIEVLDLNNQTIKIDNTNPHQAVNFGSFTYKDNIIVMGGSVKTTESGKKDFTNKVHLYNITSGYWYELDTMPTAKETTGILVNDKIYLIGGDDGKPVSKIETYNLITQKWEIEGELLSGVERPAITYHDNIIYFFEDLKMCVYDLKTKQLKEYEIELPMKYSAMYYYNTKLYILGGRADKNYSKIPSSKVVSIDINEFELTKPVKSKILSPEVNQAN
nr:carboxypeptidase-like regulatory domain-containing protein [Flavobacterium sp. ENC]